MIFWSFRSWPEGSIFFLYLKSSYYLFVKFFSLDRSLLHPLESPQWHTYWHHVPTTHWTTAEDLKLVSLVTKPPFPCVETGIPPTFCVRTPLNVCGIDSSLCYFTWEDGDKGFSSSHTDLPTFIRLRSRDLKYRPGRCVSVGYSDNRLGVSLLLVEYHSSFRWTTILRVWENLPRSFIGNVCSSTYTFTSCSVMTWVVSRHDKFYGGFNEITLFGVTVFGSLVLSYEILF